MLPPSSQIFTISGVHFGIMPTRVVMGFVKTAGYSEAIDCDPFFFDHIRVTYLYLKVALKSLRYAQVLIRNTIKITTCKCT